jgi:hypothetical protein
MGSEGRGKTRYSTLEREQYAEEWHRTDRGFNRSYPYECPTCLGFHLRTKPPNELGDPNRAQMRYDNPGVKIQDKLGCQLNEPILGAARQHEHLRQILSEAA